MDKCYYDNDLCGGELWTCETCGNQYCEQHDHVTSKGVNVECVACERERIEAQAESRSSSSEEQTMRVRVLVDLEMTPEGPIPGSGTPEHDQMMIAAREAIYNALHGAGNYNDGFEHDLADETSIEVKVVEASPSDVSLVMQLLAGMSAEDRRMLQAELALMEIEGK